MSRFCAVVLLLFLAAGCASEGQKSQWDELKKELRGDNMKMRGLSEEGSWTRE